MNKAFNLKKFLIEQRSIIALLALIAVVSFLNPNFFSVDNLLNIFRQTSVNAIIAIGMTFVILIAGIDLSVGSVLADRKSTRLNSSHANISYAVFCLKKKINILSTYYPHIS